MSGLEVEGADAVSFDAFEDAQELAYDAPDGDDGAVGDPSEPGFADRLQGQLDEHALAVETTVGQAVENIVREVQGLPSPERQYALDTIAPTLEQAGVPAELHGRALDVADAIYRESAMRLGESQDLAVRAVGEAVRVLQGEQEILEGYGRAAAVLERLQGELGEFDTAAVWAASHELVDRFNVGRSPEQAAVMAMYQAAADATRERFGTSSGRDDELAAQRRWSQTRSLVKATEQKQTATAPADAAAKGAPKDEMEAFARWRDAREQVA